MFIRYLLRLLGHVAFWRRPRVEPELPQVESSVDSTAEPPVAVPSINQSLTVHSLPHSSPPESEAELPTPGSRGSRFRLEGFPEGHEDLQWYERGGHHPVHLHDRLGRNQRYHVIHKLGNGGHATVWLCQDMAVTDTSKYVALKIAIADDSPKDCFETQLDLLKDNLEDYAGSICFPLENFQIQGPNGTHLCFVYPVLGPKASLGLSKEVGNPDAALRSVCYSLIKALSILHQAGVCHNDLTPANFLHCVAGLDGLSEDEVLRILGQPERNQVLEDSKPDHSNISIPQYLVYPLDWHEVSKDYIAEDSRLIDLGESFYTSGPPRFCGIPNSYKAPEVMLEERPGVKADLWALGCTLFEIRTGRTLFEDGQKDEDETMFKVVKTLGKLPEPWWSSTWSGRTIFFRNDNDPRIPRGQDDVGEASEETHASEVSGPSGKAVHPRKVEGANGLQEKLRPGLLYYPPGPVPAIRRSIPENEMDIFSDLLARFLQYDPDRRISAADALEHEWFKL